MVEETRSYVRCMKDGAKLLQLLDKRMADLFSVGFLPNFKLLQKVWESGSSLQANEYRALMQAKMMHLLFFYFIVNSTLIDVQVAPFVLRGIVHKNIVQCFVAFWEWYKKAVRYKTHTDKSLTSLDMSGRT